MRWNENELMALAYQTPEWEGKLQYKAPTRSHTPFPRGGSDYKERWFKLRANFLFFFRVGPSGLGPAPGTEPVGVLALEHCHVEEEGYELATIHAFSIAYPFAPSQDSVGQSKRHLFLGPSALGVRQWISALKRARFARWRDKLMNLQIKLRNRTGLNPLAGTGLEYNPHFACPALPSHVSGPNFVGPDSQASPKAKPRRSKTGSKPNFQSHVVERWEPARPEDEADQPLGEAAKKASFRSHLVPEGQLIDLS